MWGDLVPIAAIFFVFGLPVIAWVVFRILAHRECMEMIKHGMMPPSCRAKPAWPPGLTHAPRSAAPPEYEMYDIGAAQHTLHRGVRLAFIGLALTVGLAFVGHAPWLIGGLVPLFIGISQVVVALLSGARFGPVGGGTMPPAGPFSHRPRGPVDIASPLEELGRPARPPDLR